jgi:hypothetical protein
MKKFSRLIMMQFAVLNLLALSAVAADPKNLKEALLNYTWSWVNGVPEPKEPNLRDKEVRFFEDGTARSTSPLDNKWHWKLTGTNTIQLVFDEEGFKRKPGISISFDDSFSKLSYNGVRITGARLKPADQPPTTNSSGLNPNATVHKADQPQIKILSEESVNVTGWITAPLDVAVPEQIWENLNFLKEALKDERDAKPAANAASYALAVRLCLKMLEDLADRDAISARAGGAAVLHQKSNLTQQNRDNLTWPQYALERDERAERKDNARNADKFMNGHIMIEWSGKAATMRKDIQFHYSQFREALRQPK